MEIFNAIKKPVTTLEKPMKSEIWNIEDLPEQERLAILNAKLAYEGSTNPEFRAGACAVAVNGEQSVKHNHTNELGKGQEGHAEMLALDALFETVNPADRKLKILALVASYPAQELIRSEEKYTSKSVFESIHDIDAPHVCGRCLKKMSDFSGNQVPYSAENGARVEPLDPIVLILTGTNQVLRTKLSMLYPSPHVPHQMGIRPWEEKKDPLDN